jgi:hypothetical protein
VAIPSQDAAASNSNDATAAGSSAGLSLPSVCHSLQLGLRALWLSRDGCHLLKPWWRHLLFLLSLCALVALVVHSLTNMFWLVEAHCRDFLISAVLNAVITLTAGVSILALACPRQDQLALQRSNPFETIGLLDSQGDAEEIAFDANEHEEFDDHFSADSRTESIAMRTRRELEMEQSMQL